MLNVLIISSPSEPLTREIARRAAGEGVSIHEALFTDDPSRIRAELEPSHVVVLVRPAGRRGSFAVGLASGMGKRVIVLEAGGEGSEPLELEGGVVRAASIDEVAAEIAAVSPPSQFIDADWFRRRGACEEGAAWFARRYPKGGFTREWTREEQRSALADGGGRWIRLGGKRRLVAIHDMAGVDLSGCDLRRADLRGLGFAEANLERADLSGGNYRGAIFRGAKLGGAKLEGANLHGADLAGADLRGANLKTARLTSAKLAGARLEAADLSDADLSDADLSGLDLRGVSLSGALLVRTVLSGANLERADLSGLNASGASFFRARLAGAKLARTNLEGADLREILFDGATDVSGAHFHATAGAPVELVRKSG